MYHLGGSVGSRTEKWTDCNASMPRIIVCENKVRAKLWKNVLFWYYDLRYMRSQWKPRIHRPALVRAVEIDFTTPVVHAHWGGKWMQKKEKATNYVTRCHPGGLKKFGVFKHHWIRSSKVCVDALNKNPIKWRMSNGHLVTSTADVKSTQGRTQYFLKGVGRFFFHV